MDGGAGFTAAWLTPDSERHDTALACHQPQGFGLLFSRSCGTLYYGPLVCLDGTLRERYSTLFIDVFVILSFIQT